MHLDLSSHERRLLLCNKKMSTQSTLDTGRKVSEVPFAGRIGGFQQEIADDEKNREILRNQPDAVRPFFS